MADTLVEQCDECECCGSDREHEDCADECECTECRDAYEALLDREFDERVALGYT